MSQHLIVRQLTDVLSPRHVVTGDKKTEHYRSGWRSGKGAALAVVFPQTLIDFWRVLQTCVANNCIIVMQAAKTGLTEGSTPSGDDYDREVVVINTLAMNKLILLGEGEQVVSFPGATLFQLEKALAPINRAPHSVIGSSCLGASIVGGVANNSGGALVKRGPAYTELSLFAQVDRNGQLHLVNHLEIELGSTPEEILDNLENKRFDCSLLATKGKASATDYQAILRDVDADTPSRFNADTKRLYEASGCAGKIAVFAVRLDTYPEAKKEQTFYIGTNKPHTLTQIRRHILGEFSNIPEVGEYLHHEVFDIARDYGKDTFLAVKHLGTDKLPKMFAAKGRIDAVLNKRRFAPHYLTDRIMQAVAKLFPSHLPSRMTEYRNQYEHHLILKMSDEGIEEARRYLADFFSHNPNSGAYFECNDEETNAAFLHRFAAAGSAIRYQLLHEKRVGEILALDIALRRNECQWEEELPAHIADKIEKKLYYGHFFCHVFHQDYVLKKGVNAKVVKQQMLELLDTRGAKYPAEHNVGHLYEAQEGLRKFYQSLDPTNTFNPGIGKTDKTKRNCSCCV
ncbi:D-lactate dehydrogenase [Alteromonas sp. 345S023]|uniref:Quinone-dependent D-lactate dehydrogenase n=1 Tax=Alteromonas profundi TaxID=2696062 RepID=A0A7X5LNS8_9ALTE|nr:D-lactate dehydrogenase [Alteromonas profundi]NDV92344.1 D-lactate dehydrogenase [Alteromonas profundi]